MYCYKCGKQLLPDAVFCSYCGTRNPFNSDQSADDSLHEDAEEHDILSTIEEIHTTENVALPKNERREENDDDNDGKTTTFWDKAKNILYILITIISLAFIKVVVRSMVHDKDTMRVVSYAVPGFICGIVIGIISCVILVKCGNIEIKTWHIAVIVGISGFIGLVGGIPFAIGGAVISSSIIFFMGK